MVLCTLFDSNYLDKGMALYESLEKVTLKFTLYMFAFDKKCEDILRDLNYRYAKIVSYDELEKKNPILKILKQERTRAEFCWTCSSLIIEYVLEEFNEKSCTYIDADMYFFDNPNILYKEIIDSKDIVGIAPHRFKKDSSYKRNINFWGKYCVHFNTFFNCQQSLKILKEWKKQCLEDCSCKTKDRKFGDQLYLNDWPIKYERIHELEYLGGGVAPWNIGNYDDLKRQNKKVMIRKGKEKFSLIFYHFESLKYLPNRKIYMNIWEYFYPGKELFNISKFLYRKKIIIYIYQPYVNHVEKIRKMLKTKYQLSFNHLILNEEEAKKYLPNIKEGILLFLSQKRNIM